MSSDTVREGAADPRHQPAPLIIDTDPGLDDAVAILAALAAQDSLDVRALTAVAGNVPLSATLTNTLKLVELSGRGDVPVYAGAEGPLMRPLHTARHIHGATGMDGPDLPAPTRSPAPGHASEAIIEEARRQPPDTLSLVALGPLTNVALALQLAPDIAGRLKRIVIMGGAGREGGNVTPAAEFNFFCDPEAAALVFRAGVPIVLASLDVTHQAITTPEREARFAGLGSPVGDAVSAMLRFYDRENVARYGAAGGPLHDPCTIAWLIRPELFDGRDRFVEIETTGTASLGMSVIDWWGITGRAANTHVLTGVDAPGFYDLMLALLGRYPS